MVVLQAGLKTASGVAPADNEELLNSVVAAEV